MIRKRKIFISAVILIVLIVAVMWKQIVADQVKEIFQEEGFDVPELSIEQAGLNGIILKNIVFGSEPALEIPEARVTFSIASLWNSRVDSIVIKNVHLETHSKNGNFLINGLNSTKDIARNAITPYLPDFLINPDAFFFNTIRIENSSVHIHGDDVDLTMPFELSINAAPVPLITISSSGITGKYKSYDIAIGDVEGTLNLDAKKETWKGVWTTEKFSTNGLPVALPPLKMSANVTAKPSLITFDCTATNAEPAVNIQVLLNVQPNNTGMKIEAVSFPWAQGTISMLNIGTMALKNSPIITSNLRLSHVSLSEVLNTLTDEHIAAEGFLSGALPMTITEAESLIFYPGELYSEGPGTIAIPSDILTEPRRKKKAPEKMPHNFHYDRLKLAMQSGEGNNINIVLNIEGNKPKSRKGDTVNMTWQLNGDLLNLLKQTIPSASTQDKSGENDKKDR